MKRTIQVMIPVILCLLLLGGCGKSKETQKKQMELRSQGIEQALAGDYEAAVASYDAALDLADMSADALELDIAAYKASALYYAGELDEAIATCSAILDLKKSAEVYMTRGILYREAGNVQASNADFFAALEMTSKKDLVMLGRLNLYMEDYTKAKEYLEQASDTGDGDAVYWLAELYWQMGNQDYAVTLYQLYLEGDAEYQSAYARVASWQMQQEDYDSALATIQAGISKGEGNGLKELLGNEIAVYEQKGDFETAKLKMESYLEKYPEDEDAAREYIFLRSR